MKWFNLLSMVGLTMFFSSLIYTGCLYVPAAHAASEDGVAVENYDSSLRAHVYHYPVRPKRIVALWQNSIETLLSLGAVEDMAAAGGISNPEYLSEENRQAYQRIPLRSNQVLNQEMLLMLQPDLIVGWLYDFTGHGTNIGRTDFWESRGTNVYMTLMNLAEFKPQHTVFDEERYILDLGKIVGKQDTAQSEVLLIEQEISGGLLNPSMEGKTALVIGSLGRNLSVYTPRTLPGDVLQRLGVCVLGKEQERVGDTEFISYEELLLMDPDIIFLQSASKDDDRPRQILLHLEAMRGLKAVQTQQIYCVPFYLLRCPGIRVLDTIRCFKNGLTSCH